jgi:hypothetical protein
MDLANSVTEATGSIEVIPKPKEKINVKETPSPKRVEVKVHPVYKLNWRRPNGEIRADIPKAVIHTLVSRWSDLLRIVPANRWSPLDEIVQSVWDWEKRQYRPLYQPRTRQQIERGITELVEAGVVVTKS